MMAVKQGGVEQILQDAEVAATFFRALCDRGVPVQAAVNMTGQYLSTLAIRDGMKERPDEPWRGKEE
ncbi:MAG: hypothetical protein Q8K55_06455 [Gemmatimonadaceae bacterium]|nr:hypothetical protein [Gemmatimonadaceae bacterium]